MWDSFKNKSSALNLLKSIDHFFTFDPADATVYNIKFLPLFYVGEYSKIRNDTSWRLPKRYRLSFIGTAHTERYMIVKSITKNIDNVFLFFFTPNKLVFLYKKYICGELKGLRFSDVSSTPMLRKDIVTVVADSDAIVDINHPDQIGLTMRTMEILGAGRKLITTNKHIEQYDFYNENNILICRDYNDANLVESFLNKSYTKLDDEIYNRYCLSSWVRQLFGINE